MNKQEEGCFLIVCGIFLIAVVAFAIAEFRLLDFDPANFVDQRRWLKQ